MAAFVNALSAVGLGFLGAHHKNAVAKEQTGVAAAGQQIESEFADIKNAFFSGMIGLSEAKSKVDSAVNEYGSNTASIRTGGQEFFGRGWTLSGSGQGVKGQCNAACVLWSAYNDIGKNLKASFDSAKVTPSQNTSQNSQSGMGQSSSASGRPGVSGGVSFAGNAAVTPGSAAGINWNDPKILAGVAIGIVFLIVVLMRSGGK